MNTSKQRRRFGLYGTCGIIMSALCAMLVTFFAVQAQDWDHPLNPPPINNPDQPVQPSLSNHVQQSETLPQSVSGPVSVGAGSQRIVIVGDPPTSHQLGIQTIDTGTAEKHPSSATGVYAYGSEVGLFAYADDPSNMNIGIVGKSGDSNGYGAWFYGPVTVLNDPISGAGGVLNVAASVIVSEGLSCSSLEGCVFSSVAGEYWLEGTGDPAGGNGITINSTNGSGLIIDLTDPDTPGGIGNLGTANGAGMSAVSSGNESAAVYGRAEGAGGDTFIGVAGFASSVGAPSTYGVYGITNGGLGTPAGSSAEAPSGVRACVRDASGIVNQLGITASDSGSAPWAGYFTGDDAETKLPSETVYGGKILIVGGANRLCIGEICLSEFNLDKLYELACPDAPDLCGR